MLKYYLSVFFSDSKIWEKSLSWSSFFPATGRASLLAKIFSLTSWVSSCLTVKLTGDMIQTSFSHLLSYPSTEGINELEKVIINPTINS